MESILTKLQQFSSWKDILRSSCKNNGITTSLTGELTIIKARILYRRFQKTYEKEQEKLKQYWGQNQLKTFHWILITVSAIYNVNIKNFTQNQWKLLLDIFKSKQRSVLQYEAAKLLHSRDKKAKPWITVEEKLLIQIINQEGDNNRWNEVGRSLYWKSGKVYFRTGKQCRERWLNHLDPKKKHGGWTKQQDTKLVNLADIQVRKWSKIVKSFNGQRTQHMIKNRFKSLIVKQKKLTPHLKKQEKLIEAIKQRLKNGTVQRIQQNDSFDSEVSQQENDDRLKIQEKPQVVKSPVFSQEKQKQKHKAEELEQNKYSPCVARLNGNTVEDEKQNEQKRYDVLDPNISNYFEQVSDNRNQSFGGFKIYSPYCLAYSMGNNLTPTGLTPTYFSPPAFFMNSFTQNMMSFQKFLNNPEQDGKNE